MDGIFAPPPMMREGAPRGDTQAEQLVVGVDRAAEGGGVGRGHRLQERRVPIAVAAVDLEPIEIPELRNRIRSHPTGCEVVFSSRVELGPLHVG